MQPLFWLLTTGSGVQITTGERISSKGISRNSLYYIELRLISKKPENGVFIIFYEYGSIGILFLQSIANKEMLSGYYILDRFRYGQDGH